MKKVTKFLLFLYAAQFGGSLKAQLDNSSSQRDISITFITKCAVKILVQCSETYGDDERKITS